MGMPRQRQRHHTIGHSVGDSNSTTNTNSRRRLNPESWLRFGVVGSVLTFLLLWGVALYWFYASMTVKAPPPPLLMAPFSPANYAPTSIRRVSDPISDLAAKGVPEKDLYFGWQPAIPKEMECGWRDCFKSKHSCRTCRDDVEEWGPAPPAPANWIPDVTLLQRMRIKGTDANGNSWPPPLDDPVMCEPIGVSGGTNDQNIQLFEAVPIEAKPFALADDRTPKILCMVYTMEENHATNIRAIRETWASGCDGFLAFSTVSDPRIPAISLDHDGPESYDNMWQKVRSIWKFVGTHYLDDFDFFFQGGEDLFVLPQNLKNYFATLGPNASEDEYFVGRRFKGGGSDNYFNSGGSGYALSRGTLRKYMEMGWDHPKCKPKLKSSMEDVHIAQCLRDVLGIGLTDTRDDQLRERFHPFAPGAHYIWTPAEPGAPKNWYENYNSEWPPLLKEQCCAPDSVSFHYIKKPAMVRHLHALLYTCPNPPLLDQ